MLAYYPGAESEVVVAGLGFLMSSPRKRLAHSFIVFRLCS